MNPNRPDVAVIADISANVFAVFILILIIMLDLSRGPMLAGPTAPPATVDAARDLYTVERRPLRAAETVELLRLRRGGGVPVVDLYESRIEVTLAGARAPLVLDARRDTARDVLDRLERILGGPDFGRTAWLYVFSNRWYAVVTERLDRHATAWREISVPVALRAASGARAGDAWSDPFVALVARGLDRDRFRPALARLLAASPGDSAELGRSFGVPPSGGTAGAPAESLLERIKRVLGLLFAGLALSVACLSIALIERRYPRSVRLALPTR